MRTYISLKDACPEFYSVKADGSQDSSLCNPDTGGPTVMTINGNYNKYVNS